MDWLIKAAHLIDIKIGPSLEKLTTLNIEKLIRLHGVLVTIVSHFWKRLHKPLRINLNFSIGFHAQTNG